MSVPFIGKFQFLNGIFYHFVDCKFIIHHYTQFTVHKLVQIMFKSCNKEKNFSTAFLWFTIDAPQDASSYCKFLRKPHECPWWPKLEKEAIATIIGVQSRHVETIFTKFKLLNAILVQSVDCHVCIMIYYGIAIHKLV